MIDTAILNHEKAWRIQLRPPEKREQASEIKPQPTPCSVLLDLVFGLKENKNTVVVEPMRGVVKRMRFGIQGQWSSVVAVVLRELENDKNGASVELMVMVFGLEKKMEL